MTFEVRWKLYLHHLLIKHELQPVDLIAHQVGLIAVLKACPDIFANDRMKEQFLAYRWLQIKELPKHGLDSLTGIWKRHEAFDLKTAASMYSRLINLWDALPQEAKDDLQQSIVNKEAERRNKAAGWTVDSRDKMRAFASQRQNRPVETFRCLFTGAYIGKMASGSLKVLHAGRASPEQLERLTARRPNQR